MYKKETISREIPEFQIIPRRFQEWWTFGILHWKSRSLTQTDWEKYPTCWNLPNPGDSRISGCLDSRIQKSKDAPKSAKNCYNYAIGVIFFEILSKTALFWKVVKSLGKSGNWKKTKSIDELILTWKFFLLKHQSCLFLKVFKAKVVSDFQFDAF